MRAPIALVLAAGSSSRLWPLRDKALVPLGAETILVRHLRLLAEAGIAEAIVVASRENEGALIAELARVPELRTRLACQDPARSGMGAAVLAGAALLEPGAPLYVTQAHDVVEPGLHARVLAAGDGRTGVLAGWRSERYFPGGYLVSDPDGRVRDILEKPGPERVPPGGLVTIVAHLHPDPAALVDAIEAAYAAGGPDDHYERAMGALFARIPYRVHPYDGPWHPLKYPWHLLAISAHFLGGLEGADEGASVDPGARVSGAVHLGAGARVLWGAEIRGPAWIGPGAVIGQFASVRESHVGAGAVVGLGSEVNRSYLGERASMHAARVLDSVVAPTPPEMEHGANLAAGVITANLRADRGEVRSAVAGALVETGLAKFGSVIGAGAFVGINAGLMPGTKIGERSFVPPGQILYRDLADGERAR